MLLPVVADPVLRRPESLGMTKEETTRREQVKQVLDRHRERLMAEPGVIGVGVGKRSKHDEDLVIVVYLESQMNAEPPTHSVEGVSVVYRVVGGIGLQSKKGAER